jgi:hypothetical protein
LLAEARDKFFGRHFLWPGRSDSRSLALVIPLRGASRDSSRQGCLSVRHRPGNLGAPYED